jgi:molybdate transport system ATP-binding protein
MQWHYKLRQGDFTLDVTCSSPAQAIGVFGPSGSGKTTLLECLVGWRRAEASRLSIGGVLYSDSARGHEVAPELRAFGYVPQDSLLWSHHTVDHNLRAFRAQTPIVDTLYSQLDIAHLRHRSVTSLSGGERQRVALARAIALDPSVLVLDEALSSIDAPLRRRVLSFLMEWKEATRKPIICVSHDEAELQALCDELVVLQNGQVQAMGRPDRALRAHTVGTGGMDNLLAGVVRDTRDGWATVVLTPTTSILVPAQGVEVGQKALVAIQSEEILISTVSARGLSARNSLAVRLEHVQHLAAGQCRWDARLLETDGDDTDDSLLSATVTWNATQELGLQVGQTVWFLFKSSKCRTLAAYAVPSPR